VQCFALKDLRESRVQSALQNFNINLGNFLLPIWRIIMEYFGSNKLGRTFILCLNQGDMVLESINELVTKEGISNGFVVSGIGTLDQYTIHMVTTVGYPPNEYFETKKGKAYELDSLQGAIINGSPHLHVVISDTEKAYAGHLENCCRTLYLAEIIIQEIDGLDVQRVPNDKGINHIVKNN
jgi:predicted DNA-binding protein with PD1-like motif